MITVVITLCWVMTPCSLDTTYQSFGQHYFLHRIIKQQVPPQHTGVLISP